MLPRGVLVCLGFRQRRPNVRRTAQCRDFSDISKRARQPGRSNRGSTGTTKFVKVLLSNRAHNSRRSETNSPPGVCWMSLKQYSTTLYPHHGDPSPKPPAAGSSQVTQRESGIETDLGSPSGERPAAFPILVEAVERVMAHDRKLRHRVDTFTLKACIDSLQRELAKVDGCIDSLQRELALAAGHRANFERDRAERSGLDWCWRSEKRLWHVHSPSERQARETAEALRQHEDRGVGAQRLHATAQKKPRRTGVHNGAKPRSTIVEREPPAIRCSEGFAPWEGARERD